MPEKEGLDGNSLLPLLKEPDPSWEEPALKTMGRGNHVIRFKQWQYIRYSDGIEELYNHYEVLGMEQSSGRPTLRKRANRTQKVAPEEESSLANRRIQKLNLYPRNLGRSHDE